MFLLQDAICLELWSCVTIDDSVLFNKVSFGKMFDIIISNRDRSRG
jgi:hypothetical protein